AVVVIDRDLADGAFLRELRVRARLRDDQEPRLLRLGRRESLGQPDLYLAGLEGHLEGVREVHLGHRLFLRFLDDRLRDRERADRSVDQVDRSGAERDRLTDDDVLGDPLELVHFAGDGGPQKMGRGDLERGAGEHARLLARDPVPTDRADVALVGHHVRDEHEVADIDAETLLGERPIRLVDERGARRLDAVDAVDLEDRVRGRPDPVHAGDLDDPLEVRALGIDHVLVLFFADERPADPFDALDLDPLRLLARDEELLERHLLDHLLAAGFGRPDGRLLQVDLEGAGLSAARARLDHEQADVQALDEGRLELGALHSPRLEERGLRRNDDLEVLDDGPDGGDVGDGGDLDLERDLLDRFAVAAQFLLDVHGHHGRRRNASRVHELDQAGQPERDVHLGDPRVVERPQRHLRARLADRLRGHDAHRFVRVHAGLAEPARDLANDLG